MCGRRRAPPALQATRDGFLESGMDGQGEQCGQRDVGEHQRPVAHRLGEAEREIGFARGDDDQGMEQVERVGGITQQAKRGQRRAPRVEARRGQYDGAQHQRHRQAAAEKTREAIGLHREVGEPFHARDIKRQGDQAECHQRQREGPGQLNAAPPRDGQTPADRELKDDRIAPVRQGRLRRLHDGAERHDEDQDGRNRGDRGRLADADEQREDDVEAHLVVQRPPLRGEGARLAIARTGEGQEAERGGDFHPAGE